MIKYLAIFLLFLYASDCLSQAKDYLKVRDQIKLYSCGSVDSAAVYGTIRNLQWLDTNRINKNMHVYYEDLGECYWLLVNDDVREKYLTHSKAAYFKALYHKPDSPRAMWNLTLAFLFEGNCAEARNYMSKYKAVTRKKDWTPDLEQQIESGCK